MLAIRVCKTNAGKHSNAATDSNTDLYIKLQNLKLSFSYNVRYSLPAIQWRFVGIGERGFPNGVYIKQYEQPLRLLHHVVKYIQILHMPYVLNTKD